MLNIFKDIFIYKHVPFINNDRRTLIKQLLITVVWLQVGYTLVTRD